MAFQHDKTVFFRDAFQIFVVFVVPVITIACISVYKIDSQASQMFAVSIGNLLGIIYPHGH